MQVRAGTQLGGRRTAGPGGGRLGSGAAEYGSEEVMAVTIVHANDVRRRSYELLADTFDLRAPTRELAATT